MNESEATAVLVALFALRCIAPLLITLGIGYLMNRMVDRWEAEEARKRQQTPQPEVLPQPEVGGLKLPTIPVPCWVFRKCTEEQKAGCPAAQQPGIPCWLARMRAEGLLPSNCPDCPIYEGAAAAAD